ncbi:hypothetical protein [Myxococcus sp. AS-1-15]|jgi:hypothetical protein|uniref:hypothetical protein n=1 Tax=Myxococcus sp. AS-1-15 TaxID=2874600 RepID=UPI001CBF8A94|nr:hypothetical protein [Myxococcus sp. AS-1-15]MBZ4398645.1 hypothetical protein [Myxococcus sp. AS-1-15]
MTSQPLSLDVTLPALVGSPKQVEWASKERDKLIKLALGRLSSPASRAAHLRAHPEEQALFLRVLGEVVVSHADARYWIDLRGDVLTMLQEMRPGLTVGLAALQAEVGT